MRSCGPCRRPDRWRRDEDAEIEGRDRQALFFVLAPGTVVGLVPWLLTGWQFAEPAPNWEIARVLGVILIVAGFVPPVHGSSSSPGRAARRRR